MGRVSVAAALMLMAGIPLLVGQGCPGSSGVTPITPGQGLDGNGSAGDTNPAGHSVPGGVGTGNTPPFLEFTRPTNDIQREVGDVVTLSWEDEDPDDNAVITLVVDPDGTWENGNEVVVEPMLLENPDESNDFYRLDTGALHLRPGVYRVIARVNDGVNPEEIVVARGLLYLYGVGLLPGTRSPVVVVTEPMLNIGVGQGDSIPIEWCVSDPDDGEDDNGETVLPDILVLLDLDDDPTNDLDLSAVDAEAVVEDVCTVEYLPRPIRVAGQIRAYVIGCTKDVEGGTAGDCADPFAAPTLFPPTGEYVIDATDIPPRVDGAPYRVRVTAWDYTNPPVHDYAKGYVSVTSMASGGSGVVDLGNVGRTISGTRFLGFDAGAWAGSTGTTLGDFDGDGADDFVIVARYGRPFERGNVGAAYLVYGTPGTRFGSEIYLNSVGTEYRGAGFAMGETVRYEYPVGYVEGVTEGITCVTSIADMNGDGSPEIIFGAPYVEGLYDWVDDDPCDKDDYCYGDLEPNPLSDGEGNDDLGIWDWREGYYTYKMDDGAGGTVDVNLLCSNDSDLMKETPIDQGYVFYVRSDNPLDGAFIDLVLVGMKDPDDIWSDEGTRFSGGSAPNGARFRGGWYAGLDYSQTRYPYAIIPDNDFGRTVASMPDMGNGSINAGRDGVPELLLSAPGSYSDRGVVIMVHGLDFATWSTQPVQSLPRLFKCPIDDPCFRCFDFSTDRRIFGSAAGDLLGYGSAAGDFNLDGNQDILCGAPGADRGGAVNSGIVYVIFGRLAFGDLYLGADLGAGSDFWGWAPAMNPPRIELRGTRSGDRFGEIQTLVGDMNQDGLPDIGFASPWAGDDGPGGLDSGFVGVVFGGRRLTGENLLTVDQVGTAQLPGVRFYGTQVGGHAGASINAAGDFNGDGKDDLLIVAPEETRMVGGLMRRGVAYLVFGGSHLHNKTFLLSEVGTAKLPGIIFASAYAADSADEAPLNWAGSAGDVNADGFDDILIGAETADFVNPLMPTQRRIDAGECYLIYGNNAGANTVW